MSPPLCPSRGMGWLCAGTAAVHGVPGDSPRAEQPVLLLSLPGSDPATHPGQLSLPQKHPPLPLLHGCSEDLGHFPSPRPARCSPPALHHSQSQNSHPKVTASSRTTSPIMALLRGDRILQAPKPSPSLSVFCAAAPQLHSRTVEPDSPEQGCNSSTGSRSSRSLFQAAGGKTRVSSDVLTPAPLRHLQAPLGYS